MPHDIHLLGFILWIVGLSAIVYWGRTFDRQHFDLVGKRNYFFALSAAFVVLSLGVLFTKGLKYGLDFTGGTILELGAYKQVTVADVENSLKSLPDIGQLQIQVGTELIDDPSPVAGEPPKYQKVIVRVTTSSGDHLSPTQSDEALKQLKVGIGDFKELRTASIGPTISGELTQNAIKALGFALVAQLLYIFFRFGNQVRFGIAADLALIHDLIIMLGFYSLAELEVDSPFIAALLTVVGYSVMDSVVIFDRIRENLMDWWNEHGDDQEAPFDEIANASLCQTMSRSINTVVTVLITLVAIHYFGGETLQNFSYALLVGLVAGCYSSIFLASNLVVAINKKHPIAPPAHQSASWYEDEDEVVPEHHMEPEPSAPRVKKVPKPQQRVAPQTDDEVEDVMPQSSGRRRSRGKRS